eukprot:scaffold726_cov262-Pinguiococcus_pyrenoidosus.AAC.25
MKEVWSGAHLGHQCLVSLVKYFQGVQRRSSNKVESEDLSRLVKSTKLAPRSAVFAASCHVGGFHETAGRNRNSGRLLSCSSARGHRRAQPTRPLVFLLTSFLRLCETDQMGAAAGDPAESQSTSTPLLSPPAVSNRCWAMRGRFSTGRGWRHLCCRATRGAIRWDDGTQSRGSITLLGVLPRRIESIPAAYDGSFLNPSLELEGLGTAILESGSRRAMSGSTSAVQAAYQRTSGPASGLDEKPLSESSVESGSSKRMRPETRRCFPRAAQQAVNPLEMRCTLFLSSALVRRPFKPRRPCRRLGS